MNLLLKSIIRPGVLIPMSVLVIELFEEGWVDDMEFIRVDPDNQAFAALQVRFVALCRQNKEHSAVVGSYHISCAFLQF